MATTVRDLKKSCPICGEPLASSGAYDIHVARAHGADAYLAGPGSEEQSVPRPAERVPARRPRSPLPLLAFVMAAVLAVAGVAVVVDRSGHHGAGAGWGSFDNHQGIAAGGGTCWGLDTFQKLSGTKSVWPAAGCANGVDPTKGTSAQTSTSPTFSQPPFSQMQATVDVDPTLAVAKADFGSLDAVMTCVRDGFAKAAATGAFGNLPRGVTAKVGPVEPIQTFPYGDASAARRVTITVQGPGGSIPLSFDVRVVRRQRIVAVLMTFTNGSTPTADQEQDLVGKMASRMP